MLSADDNENKPIGKVSQRKKAEGNKKNEPRKRKDAQKNAQPAKTAQPAPKPDQVLEALQRLGEQPDEIIAPVAEPVPSTPIAPSESSPSETTLVETSPVAPVQSDATPVSLQTIADAYGDYSKKSLEQTSSFVAKLAGARSFANAFELQTAFAREAYETFMEQSRRIREMHRELAKQRLTKLEGLVGITRGR
jgi:phasin protein